ncbi:hypothetical protein ACHAWU_010249 [Discostella pseudostelligera]|uniref:Uncharacterized protein n=1 Tax=Discostella pseudostelligera TaxID=259834 RepID=A0ABD3N0K8_9STRA
MAATLLLRSSCIPPDGIDDAINRSKGKGGEIDEGLARSSATVANDGNGDVYDDVSVLRAPSTARSSGTLTAATSTSAISNSGMMGYSHNSDESAFRGRKSSTSFASSHARNRNINNDNLDDFEYIASQPIQCDISLIPRLPITTINDDSIGNPFNDTKEHTQNNDNTHRRQQRKQRGGRRAGTVLHFPRQPFHPCGMNNVIVIDQLLPTSSTHNLHGSGSTDESYLLSLTQCVVNIEHDGITTTNPTYLDASLLPVLASPSTFQFSFRNRQNKLHSTDHISYERLALGAVAVGEIHVAFDYSLALEYYHEIFHPSHDDTTHQNHEQEATTCDHVKSTSFSNNTTFSSSSKSSSFIKYDATSHPNGEMNEAVASLRQSIMNESLFLTKALLALGCMGIVFIIALIWAIRRIMNDKAKRFRGRRNIRRLVVNDGVPREIGLEQPSLDTAHGRHSGSDQDATSPLMSPLRMSTHRNDDIVLPMQASASDAIDNGARTIHETLHLISPSTPSHQATKSIHPTQSVEECSSTKSLRHWYEDYLSPPGKPNKHPHGRSHSDVNDVVSSFNLAPTATSAEESGSTAVKGNSPIEDDVALQLSLQMDSSLFADDVSLDGCGENAQLPVTLSLLDACDDFPDESTANNEEDSSRASAVDPEVTQDLCNITHSSCPSSTCNAVEDGSSQSCLDDIANQMQDETVCDVYLPGSNAIGLGQTLVYESSLLVACDDFPKDSTENDDDDSCRGSVSDPEMTEDQCNVTLSSCPSPNNVAEDELLCDVDLEGSNATGLGQKLVDVCSLLDACDDVLKHSAVYVKVPRSRESVSDPEMIEDQCNATLSCCPSTTCNVAEDEKFSLDEGANHTQEESVCDFDLPGSATTNLSSSAVCLPKIKIEQSPCRFAAELVERATGTKAPSPDAALNDFSTLLAQRAFEIETGKSVPAIKKNSFVSSLAKRVADVETLRISPSIAQKEAGSPDVTPASNQHKRKPLTPLGSCESSQSGITSDEFLSDYW